MATTNTPNRSVWDFPPLMPSARTAMITLGVVLLIVGFIIKNPILWSIGIILLIIGAVLFALGAMGRAVGGRKHYY